MITGNFDNYNNITGMMLLSWLFVLKLNLVCMFPLSWRNVLIKISDYELTCSPVRDSMKIMQSWPPNNASV